MQRILTLLTRKSDMSASDLANEAYVGLTTLVCGGYLKALREKRLVHISGWRKARNGFVTPLYSLGNRPDLPQPLFKDEDRNSEGMNAIVAALSRHGPMTYLELANATGLSPNTIKNARYLDILAKQNRIHISSWRRNRAGPMVAVYAFGQGTTKEKPSPLNRAEKCRRYREKMRALSCDRSLESQLKAAHAGQ